MIKRFWPSYLKLIVILTVASVFIFVGRSEILAQNVRRSDAIAIRVIPNPNHYSATYWFEKQSFSGSPQKLEVDGYSAVRDGRTVYINAANIEGGSLYTNIYVMSYNRTAERETNDIFGQILSHWKFNNNLVTASNCRENTTKACLFDSDCDKGDICLSEKAKVIRDTRRLEGLAEIDDLLEDFHNRTGKYPILDAGTYIAYNSISTWPSWVKKLSNSLGKNLPVDPINKLGPCPGYEPVTCWNENTKEFADSDTSNTTIDLPADSNVYIYTGTPTGVTYDVCGVMESGYISGAGSGSCAGGSAYGVGASTGNNQPQFVGDNLAGLTGREYSGFLQAIDPDGDPLTWTIDVSGSSWIPNAWSSAPTLENTPVPSQKELSALITGDPGNYTVTITLDDGRGLANSTISRTYTISVTNPPPDFFTPDYIYSASSTNPMDYIFTASDDPSNYPLNYLMISGTLPDGISDTFSQVGMIYEYRLSGTINPVTNPIPAATNYPFTLQLSDTFGATNNDSFVVSVTNNAPIFGLDDVEFLVGPTKNFNYSTNVIDPEHNYPLAFSTVSGIMPSNLSDNFVYNGSGYTFSITGIVDPIANPVPVDTVYSFNFRVTDEYGAVSNRAMNITLRNNPPAMDAFNCIDHVRINNAYPACTVHATDPDGHAIASFDYMGLPPGMGGNPTTGVISGNPAVSGDFNVQVRAVDEYGAVGPYDDFNIRVYTYCGDNAKQTPNMEHRGGPGDHGMEDCDGADGIAPNPSASGPNLQYACTTPPECGPIGPCPGTCRYTGGYCGDGIVQTAYGEMCDDMLLDQHQICTVLAANGILDLDGSVLDCANLANNLWSATGLEDLYRGVCFDCNIGCIADPNFNLLGVGCYLDTNGTPGIQTDDCQKGRYICNSGVVQCHDTFTDSNYVFDFAKNGGNPVFDQCCRYFATGQSINFNGIIKVYPGNDYSCIMDGCDGITQHGNNDINYLQGPASTLGFQDLLPWAYQYPAGVPRTGYEYNCDEVCKWRGNRICIGVGLTDHTSIVTACKYDNCDSGPTCNSGGNLADTTCKANFHYWSTHSCWDGVHVFPVKSTACYCF